MARRRQGDGLEPSFDAADAPWVVRQPRDRGSAAEVLLATYCIHRRDHDATVAIVHAGCDTLAPTLAAGLAEAANFVNQYPRWIFVVGGTTAASRASGPWVVPAAVLGCSSTAPVWRVQRLTSGWRPPRHAPDDAPALRTTGVMIAKASRLVERARALVPDLHRQLLQAAALVGTSVEARALDRAYAMVPALDFGAAILEQSVAHLAVSVMPEPWGCGGLGLSSASSRSAPSKSC